MKIDSDHYTIPPKAWLYAGGGESRSRHSKSSHSFHKRRANRLARKVGKQIVREHSDA